MLFNILFIVTENVLIFNFHLDIYFIFQCFSIMGGKMKKKNGLGIQIFAILRFFVNVFVFCFVSTTRHHM